MQNNSIFQDSALSSTQKLVLIALVDVADADGFARVTVADLARRCSLCERSIQNITAALSRRGTLRIDRDGQSANGYRVSM